MEYKEKVTDKTYPDNLIQIKLVGDTYNGAYAPGVTMRQSPSGYQVVVREGHNEARGKLLVVIHGFKNATGCDVAVDIPKGYQLVNAYSYKDEGIAISDGKIRYTFDEDMKAIGIYLSRDDSSECRNAILP